MNAAFELVSAVPRHLLIQAMGPRRAVFLLGQLDRSLSALSTEELRGRLGECFALDLAGLLNSLPRAALEHLALSFGLQAGGSIGELRGRLWLWGARREAGGDAFLGSATQPVPIVLGGRLVMLGAARGLWPPYAPARPLPLPPPAPAPRPEGEPECLEDLLANADSLIGVRLGPAHRNKGAFGAAIAAMLGVRERGVSEPDWRGEVEIKSVPVIRDRSGWWRVKEDPAISMARADPLAKLSRVLWIARVAEQGASMVLSWYYQERDTDMGRLQRKYLHTRPKGGMGTSERGWYLHKRYFAESGFLCVLNG